MRKIKKSVKRLRAILSAVLVMTLLVGSMSIPSLDVKAASPSESGDMGVEILEAEIVEDADWSSGIMPYTMLTRCQISVTGDSKGMHIGITTGAVGVASVIGVKDIKVQKKTWNGDWETVATCSGAKLYNNTSIAISILYEDAVKGATYKITCVHYADVDGYTECDADSGSFKFNF